MRYRLVPRRERFAILVAQGALPGDAIIEAYGRTDLSHEARLRYAGEGGTLMQNTDVSLRIQELRRPIIRKVQRTFEYNLNRALEDAEDAYNIAYEAGQANTMLAAIELRAKLCKFLTETVEHRHGLLDDASTATLIEMKKHIERQKKGQLRLINSTAETVPLTPEHTA